MLAIETDIDHVHVFVSAPPRFSPANIANILKGYSSRFLREKFPTSKKLVVRIAYGLLPITLEQQAMYLLKSSRGILPSASESDM